MSVWSSDVMNVNFQFLVYVQGGQVEALLQFRLAFRSVLLFSFNFFPEDHLLQCVILFYPICQSPDSEGSDPTPFTEISN